MASPKIGLPLCPTQATRACLTSWATRDSPNLRSWGLEEEVHQVSRLLQDMVLGYMVGGTPLGSRCRPWEDLEGHMGSPDIGLPLASKLGNSSKSGKSGMPYMLGKSGKSDLQGKGIIPIP